MKICECKLPVPHRHPNGEHWCDRCGGYLGTAGKLDGPAGTHEMEGCHCPPCVASLCGAPKEQDAVGRKQAAE